MGNSKSIRRTVFALCFGMLLLQGPAVAQESVHLTVGPQMTFYSPYNVGWGFGTGVGARVSKAPLFIGADLGFTFLGDVSITFPTATSINNSGATAVAILPTIYYRHENSANQTIRPYAGLSVGPNIFVQSVPSSATTTTSETRIFFEFLLRPGLDLYVSQQVKFLFETRFGVLRRDFVFQPSLAVLVGF